MSNLNLLTKTTAATKLTLGLILLSLSSAVVSQKIDKNFKYEAGVDDTPIEGKVICVTITSDDREGGYKKSFFVYTNYCSYRIESAFFPLTETKTDSNGKVTIVDRPAAKAVMRASLNPNESVSISKELSLQGTNGIESCKSPLVPKDNVTSAGGYICVKKSQL